MSLCSTPSSVRSGRRSRSVSFTRSKPRDRNSERSVSSARPEPFSGGLESGSSFPLSRPLPTPPVRARPSAKCFRATRSGPAVALSLESSFSKVLYGVMHFRSERGIEKGNDR